MLIPHSTERPWANGERHALHIYAMIYHSYIIGKRKSKKLKLLDVLMEKQEIWGKDFPLRKILSCLLPFTTKLLYPLSVGNIHIVSFFFINANEVQGGQGLSTFSLTFENKGTLAQGSCPISWLVDIRQQDDLVIFLIFQQGFFVCIVRKQLLTELFGAISQFLVSMDKNENWHSSKSQLHDLRILPLSKNIHLRKEAK